MLSSIPFMMCLSQFRTFMVLVAVMLRGVLYNTMGELKALYDELKSVLI